MSPRVIDLFTGRTLDDAPPPPRVADELALARRNERLWREEYERMRGLADNWEKYAHGFEHDYQQERALRLAAQAAQAKLAQLAAQAKLAQLAAAPKKPLWRTLWKR